ncbi:MAG: E3 binding domain-containing protein [Oscillospiraceae bacterium]|nr:E3 binding domain-containing protein [Oscillospiraceae bacterium]
MPPGGQTTDESVIFAWRKKVGDKIELGDVLFEIETDKTVLEVESFCKGWLRAVKFGEGETAPTGETVAYVGEIDEPIPKDGESGKAVKIAPAQKPEGAMPIFAEEKSGRSLASPLAKKIARENNIDLKDISGAKIIKKRDVLEHISKKNSAEKNLRLHFASVEADMTSCMAFANRLKDYCGIGHKAALDGIMAKCSAIAGRKFPMLDLDEVSFGEIKEKAVSIGREVKSRDMMDITAVFDCRETGAQFLAELKSLLECPDLFVLMMAEA